MKFLPKVTTPISLFFVEKQRVLSFIAEREKKRQFVRINSLTADFTDRTINR